MKKKLLFMFLAAGLFFAGCSDGSGGSSGGDDTPSLPGNPNPAPQNPAQQLPSTYVDISGTWYYTRIWNGEALGEYKAVIEYKEDESLPSKLSIPLGIAFTCEKITPDGYSVGKEWGVYDRSNNKMYDWSDSIDKYSTVSKINSDKVSINLYVKSGNNIFTTMDSNLILSRTSGSSGGSDPQGPGNPGSEDLTLSGLYSVAEQSGVTLTFNSNGTWEKVYNGLQRKEGTFSQSGSTVTLTFNGKNAEFTVSSSNGKLILTAKNTSDADTISVIATGLQLSSSVASGKVTLSK